jgi:hypothetical protein
MTNLKKNVGIHAAPNAGSAKLTTGSVMPKWPMEDEEKSRML